MKATGIVRRIDELGRVVIPKEIRRTQRIRRGDPLEIFTTGDGEVIFKKYSPMEKTLLPCEGAPRVLLCAAPVLAGGDVTGAVGLLTEDRAACPEDAQCKAVAVAAAFLAKQMEE